MMDNACMKHGAFGWFELMTTDVGRFCVLQDSQGAVLMAMTYLKK